MSVSPCAGLAACCLPMGRSQTPWQDTPGHWKAAAPSLCEASHAAGLPLTARQSGCLCGCPGVPMCPEGHWQHCWAGVHGGSSGDQLQYTPVLMMGSKEHMRAWVTLHMACAIVTASPSNQSISASVRDTEQ